MLVWFVVLATAGVLAVFGDPRMDHRLVAVGAIAPIPLDLLIGTLRGDALRSGPFHAITTHVGLLTVVMLGSIGRRPLRKRLLAVVLGGFAHLVLDASFVDTPAFLWPLTNGTPGRLQVVQRGVVVGLLLELVGAVVGYWLVRRCHLGNASRRDAYLRSGSLSR